MQLSVHLGAQDQLSASHLRLEAFPLAGRDLEADSSPLFLSCPQPQPTLDAQAFAERLFDPQLAFARCPGHRPYVRGIPRVAVGGKPLHLDVANAVSLEVVHHPITRPRKPGARLDAVELGNAADVFERALARILASNRLKLRLRNDVLVEWFGRG